MSDHALYGIDALRLNYAWKAGFAEWWTTMMSVAPKPPILPWTGQFLVPLGRTLGHVESGLLFAVFAAQCVTMIFLYWSFAELARDAVIALVGCLGVVATPVFSGISKQFYVQPVQLMVVAWFIFIMVGSRRWDSLTTFLQLTAAVSLALLTMLSTPPFCLLPGAVALFFAATRLKCGIRFRTAHVWLLALAFGLAALTAAWYLANAGEALDYADWAFGYFYSGTSGSSSYVLRFETWLYLLFNAFTPLVLVAVVPLAAALYLSLTRKGDADNQFTCFAVLGFLQMGLVLAFFSSSENQESRYVLALAPYLALVTVWALSRVGKRWVTAAAASAFVVGVFTSQQHYFRVGAVSETPYGRGLELKRGRNFEVMQFVAELTRHTPGPIVLGTHELGFHNLELSFEAAKAPGYRREAAIHVDQIEFIMTHNDVKGDPAKAWSYIVAMNPTYVVVADPERQRRAMQVMKGGWRLVLEGTLAVSREVARSHRFERVPTPEHLEIEVYRSVSQG